jgi:endonuclease/exonuclease/phosphatase family metal-dependent hydrolase
VSFNIAFARNIDGAIALLTSEPHLRGADVILLQEMDAAGTRRIADALGMGYVYYPAILHRRTRRDFGNAVVSRWPIVGDAKLVLPHPSRYARTHRTATMATLQVGTSRVRVYSTHLGTALDIGSRQREDQLRAILADAAAHPLVVVSGDLNSAHIGLVAVQAGYSWPTREGPRTTRFGRWDHIFLKGLESPAAAASGTVVDARDASDHVPVWAMAVLPRSDRAPAQVLSRSDSAWAAVGRNCGVAEPVWDPPLDSLARQLRRARDADWASIAREVPGGFAGLYVEQGRVVLLLTDTLQKAAALPAVARRLPRPDLDIEHARVVQARWSFAQLHDWWAHIASQRMRFEGLTMFDIDERENRLVYGFRDSTSLRVAEANIERLELPCYLVAFVLREPVRVR